MKEEKKGATNNSWRRIFKKKWFFPALYLALAAFLLTGVIWYQNSGNQLKSVVDEPEEEQPDDSVEPAPYDEDATSVIEQQEVIKMPLEDQDLAEIVTTFYDYNAPQEAQESGVTRFNNSYYQSPGIDITVADDEAFIVSAAISGTVEEVKQDPLLGNVVVLEHENDITTYYASLDDVNVDVGAKVKQGEEVGTAGKNLFGKDIGTHLHFQIRKDGQKVNPETYFNQSLSKLDDISSEDESDDNSDDSEDDEQPEQDEENQELEEDEKDDLNSDIENDDENED